MVARQMFSVVARGLRGGVALPGSGIAPFRSQATRSFAVTSPFVAVSFSCASRLPTSFSSSHNRVKTTLRAARAWITR
eukprot:1178948-Prorocentrum_minimum.AAC.3